MVLFLLLMFLNGYDFLLPLRMLGSFSVISSFAHGLILLVFGTPSPYGSHVCSYVSIKVLTLNNVWSWNVFSHPGERSPLFWLCWQTVVTGILCLVIVIKKEALFLHECVDCHLCWPSMWFSQVNQGALPSLVLSFSIYWFVC